MAAAAGDADAAGQLDEQVPLPGVSSAATDQFPVRAQGRLAAGVVGGLPAMARGLPGSRWVTVEA